MRLNNNNQGRSQKFEPGGALQFTNIQSYDDMIPNLTGLDAIKRKKSLLGVNQLKKYIV